MNENELPKEEMEKLAQLVSSFSNSKDELKIQFSEVVKWVYQYSKAEPSSVIEGKIQLNLESEPSALYCQVVKDGQIVYTRLPGTTKTEVKLEEYPNLATEAPLRWILTLLNCGLCWEIVVFSDTKILTIRVVTDESQYTLVPKAFVAVQGTETGSLIWGDGKGEVTVRSLWPSYQLPEFTL